MFDDAQINVNMLFMHMCQMFFISFSFLIYDLGFIGRKGDPRGNYDPNVNVYVYPAWLCLLVLMSQIHLFYFILLVLP